MNVSCIFYKYILKKSNIDAEELSTDEESSLMMDEDGIDFYEYDGDSDNYKKAKDQAERT